MKRVHSAANLPEAQILVDLLGHRGIRALVLNANASSVAGELPIDVSQPQVWVQNPRDAERARELIDAFLRSSNGPPTKCPACGEENPSSFDLCWSCGTGLER
jgi:hypothetical protein